MTNHLCEICGGPIIKEAVRVQRGYFVTSDEFVPVGEPEYYHDDECWELQAMEKVVVQGNYGEIDDTNFS